MIDFPNKKYFLIADILEAELDEADRLAESNSIRLSHNEVFRDLKKENE